MKQFKKLQLKKEVVANLNKQEMKHVVGGVFETAGLTCGPNCRSDAQWCPVQEVTQILCGTFAESNLTCNGKICGSDVLCTSAPTDTQGGYSCHDLCSGNSICQC